MNRRNFFKAAAIATAGSGLVAMDNKSEPDKTMKVATWRRMGSGKLMEPDRKQTKNYDVTVIGAGMAGICAAVAAARNGAKTVLVQDRPVLGGNASSEIRVTVNGVNHLKGSGQAERETGIVEEILLLNRFMNPQESYPVWDHVLYEFVSREPNLELMLNTQAVDVEMDCDRIRSAVCWQMTTETQFKITAANFIDASGDGMLAAKAGALYRTGREASSEFNETFAPEKADGWQMGCSILMQGKDMGKTVPYVAPSFAIKVDPSKMNRRNIKNYIDGYWWVELGSDFDNVGDFEKNRHKLMGYLHGVWDYIKNSGDHPESANYALDWVGSLPGRRESRRFIGDHILSEKDLVDHVHFEDAIGYGGWSLDEHCPGGIENPNDPPSYFHYHFSKVYQIPYRCLYSKNISNLYFAGRNVSQTHIALSSTRIQGTCALMGQAVGTGAAMCAQKKVSPRTLGKEHITALQEQLMRDDVFIPNRSAKDEKNLAAKAVEVFADSTKSGEARSLVDGVSRDVEKEKHHWESVSLPATVQMEWEEAVSLSAVELKCDTNVKVNITMRKSPAKNPKQFITTVPPELVKSLSIELRVDGKWIEVGRISDNQTRMMKFNFERKIATALKITVKETYGAPTAKLFEVRCYG